MAIFSNGTAPNIDKSKSYATEANLNKALAAIGLNRACPLVVRNRAGRWTAVFSAARLTGAGLGIATAAHLGFMTLG